MTASMDSTAIVWDLAAQSRATAPTHAGKVLGITVSPDGSTAASLGGDGLALVWNCGTGTLQASLQVGLVALTPAVYWATLLHCIVLLPCSQLWV